MVWAVAAFIAAALITLIVTPLVIAVAKKLKLRQTVLEYVDNHALKSGTPTMGGLAFILGTAAAFLMFARGDKTLAVICLIIFIGYGTVGFLDDFIKVWYKQNKGLSPWQKIIFQVAIAVLVALFAYFSPYVGDRQFIPVTFDEFYMGVFAVLYYIAVFLAAGNAVNLIDGLDGLAAGVTRTYILCFSAVLLLSESIVGVSFASAAEVRNVYVLNMALAGALFGFGVFNCYPAKIFMGDTGSLALGGIIAGIAIVTGMTLLLVTLGIMYVITALSVIIQVAVYKSKKRRVFLMSPIHHHFERKGIHENRIVNAYCLITLLTGVSICCLVLLIN